MKDPHTLSLSASSLDIFTKCPRLFFYRYLDEDKLFFPLQDKDRLGNQFHRLVQLLTPLSESERKPWLDRLEPQLLEWWQAFCRSGLDQVEEKFYSEFPILVEFQGWQLQARYDRLVVNHNHYQIWDWKTGQKRNTWQKKLYPLLVHLGLGVEPSLISVHFWYLHHPQISFAYSDHQKKEDQDFLVQTLEQIANLDFPKTNDKKHCIGCFFRYHCWGND